MHLSAIVAALALLGSTHVPPNLHHPVSAVDVQVGALQIQPRAFTAYFQAPDEAGTYMQQLFDHAPADLPAWTLATR